MHLRLIIRRIRPPAMEAPVCCPGGTRAAKRMKYSGKIVTIKAGTGKEQEDFCIHESLATATSEYLREKLRSRCVHKTVDLAGDSPNVVAAYVDWCYSGQITSKDEIVPEDENSVGDEFIFLAHLYVFGEGMQDDKFCNAVMTAFCQLNDDNIFSYVPPNAVAIIYAGTPVGSPARKHVVDIWQGYGGAVWLDEEGARENLLSAPDFLIDLIRAQYKNQYKWEGYDKIFPLRDTWYKKQFETEVRIEEGDGK